MNRNDKPRTKSNNTVEKMADVNNSSTSCSGVKSAGAEKRQRERDERGVVELC